MFYKIFINHCKIIVHLYFRFLKSNRSMFFSKLGFTLCKTEQPLQEEEAQKD